MIGSRKLAVCQWPKFVWTHLEDLQVTLSPISFKLQILMRVGNEKVTDALPCFRNLIYSDQFCILYLFGGGSWPKEILLKILK